jgi:hypothetical protein
MAFSQATITEVRILPVPRSAELVVTWSSTSPEGTTFQLYMERRLVWSGTDRRVTLPWPASRVRIEVGTVGDGEAGQDFSASVPIGPGTGPRVSLAWYGGRYLVSTRQLRGFHVYGPGSGAETVTQVDLKDNAAFTITAGTGGINTLSSIAWGGAYYEANFGFPSLKGYWQSTGLAAGTYRVQVSVPTSLGADTLTYKVWDGAIGSGTLRATVVLTHGTATIDQVVIDSGRSVSFTRLGDILCSTGTLTVELDTGTQSNSADIWVDAMRVCTVSSPIDYSAPVAFLPGKSGDAWPDGAGRGRAGRGRAGFAELPYRWQSQPHAEGGTKSYGVRSVDEAGNEATAATASVVVSLPPKPPQANAQGGRVAYTFNVGPPKTATLTWTAPS